METEFGVEVQDSRSCEGDTRVVRNNYLNYLLYKPQGNFVSIAIKDLGGVGLLRVTQLQ